MATTNVKWNIPAAGAIATVLSTELNGLTNTSVVTASAVIANRTDLFQYGQFELSASNAVFPANGYVNIWLRQDMGTGYETITTASLARPADASISLNVGNMPQIVTSPVMMIPPHNFMVAFQNQAGVTMGATGSVLRIIRFIDQGSDA